ncbi:MAG: TlyA family rRNA (cytidine-2'-O)-methyltransferase, partial [Clostridiales bacterium]|nr:TlyA family rRNA (cytidine-2'-O)-methyltransferase [Clostridiales bacterium]
MASAKKRLDTLLVERGLFPSRERAKGTIMAGLVRVDGKVMDKAGFEGEITLELFNANRL